LDVGLSLSLAFGELERTASSNALETEDKLNLLVVRFRPRLSLGLRGPEESAVGTVGEFVRSAIERVLEGDERVGRL
jgi:hypothetical protein